MSFTSHQSRVTSHVFVHLHCHSHYSFLRGVASPEEIVAAAVEQKMPAVALTDTNGLYAAVPFYQAAKDAGIQPIVGVVLDVQSPFDSTPGKRVTNGKWRERTGEISRYARNDGNKPSTTLVLLAMNMEGYSNLCRLVTLRHLGTTKLAQKNDSTETDGRPVTLQELAQHNRGVIALAPANHPQLRSFAPLKMTSEKAKPTGNTSYQSPVTNHFSQLKEIFGDRLYIEVQHLSPGDGRTLREAERIGRELSVPLVATNNVHFL